jgi:host factor-I protein
MTFHSNISGKSDREHSNRDMKLQDVFLNHCRREKIQVTIQLMDQSFKSGQIIGFDSQSIILEEEGRQHLIYKSAIVAVNPQQIVNYIFNESYRNELLKGYSEYSADFAQNLTI